MRVAILLAAILMTSGSAIAGAISITSPDHAQTFAYGEMIWHQLYLEREGGELAARITLVIYLMLATTSHAGTNRSTFAFQCQF
jgi:hypothetical protein